MRRHILWPLIGTALIGVGWSVGYAQNAEADFEILVTASGASTNVQCVRGCALAGAGRPIPSPGSSPGITLTCEPPDGLRGGCGSMRVAGGRRCQSLAPLPRPRSSR